MTEERERERDGEGRIKRKDERLQSRLKRKKNNYISYDISLKIQKELLINNVRITKVANKLKVKIDTGIKNVRQRETKEGIKSLKNYG